MTEITELPWCRHGINKSGYCADCKVESLITTIESQNTEIKSLKVSGASLEDSFEANRLKDDRLHDIDNRLDEVKRENRKLNAQIESQKEEIELKESEYQATITKLNKAHKAIESLQNENQRLRVTLQNSSDDISSLIIEYPNELWMDSEKQRWVDIGNDRIAAINNSLSHIQEGK